MKQKNTKKKLHKKWQIYPQLLQKPKSNCKGIGKKTQRIAMLGEG